MRGGVRLTPGLRFVYWAEKSDVCVLVLDGTVITILTRTLCRRPQFPVMPGDVTEPIYARHTDMALFNPYVETEFGEAA